MEAILPSITQFLDTLPKIQPKDLPEDHRNCTICMEPFFTDDASAEIPISLPCGHIFGSSCLKTWVSPLQVRKPTCPMCRATLKPPSTIQQWETFAELMLQEPYNSASRTLRRVDENDSAVELVWLFFKVVVQMTAYHRRHRIRASALLLRSARAVADRMAFLYVLLKEQIKSMDVLVPWNEAGLLVGTILDLAFEQFYEASFERLVQVERVVTSELGSNV